MLFQIINPSSFVVVDSSGVITEGTNIGASSNIRLVVDVVVVSNEEVDANRFELNDWLTGVKAWMDVTNASIPKAIAIR